MKKTNVFLPALCMAALFCSCSGGSDSGDDLLASPLKVIENIDIDLTSESLSRSAQVARTVSPSDEGGAASPVMALSAPGVRLMAANGEIAVLAEKNFWEESDPTCMVQRVRGDWSAPTQILDIVKKEIANEVRSRNLPFGQAMTNLSITASRLVEKEPHTDITINYFRADLEGLTAYLYSYGTVLKEGVALNYNFVLKCVPNILGMALDPELYMELIYPNGHKDQRLSKITTSRNQKVREEYGIQTSDDNESENFWEQFIVMPSKITAYKYSRIGNTEERATILISGNYVARIEHDDGGMKLVNGTTGIPMAECVSNGSIWTDKDGGTVLNNGGLTPSALKAEMNNHPYKTSTPPSVSSIPSDLTSRLTSR